MNRIPIYFLVYDSTKYASHELVKQNDGSHKYQKTAMIIGNNVLVTQYHCTWTVDTIGTVDGPGVIYIGYVTPMMYNVLLRCVDIITEENYPEIIPNHASRAVEFSFESDNNTFSGFLNNMITQCTGNLSTIEIRTEERVEFDNVDTIYNIVETHNKASEKLREGLRENSKNVEQYNESINVESDEDGIILPSNAMSLEERKNYMYNRQQDYVNSFTSAK